MFDYYYHAVLATTTVLYNKICVVTA